MWFQDLKMPTSKGHTQPLSPPWGNWTGRSTCTKGPLASHGAKNRTGSRRYPAEFMYIYIYSIYNMRISIIHTHHVWESPKKSIHNMPIYVSVTGCDRYNTKPSISPALTPPDSTCIYIYTLGFLTLHLFSYPTRHAKNKSKPGVTSCNWMTSNRVAAWLLT